MTQDHPLPAGTDPGAALMVAWQAGDEGAFEALVEQHSARVYSLLTRFLGRHPDREDMVQEVFLRVVRARDRYEPTARFTTWLYCIVFNMSVNKTQREVGRQPISLDHPIGLRPGGDAVDSMASSVSDERIEGPSSQLERDDVVLAVRAAIASLPEKQRMALVLAKYDDMPYVEIAKVLDSSSKAVKSLIHRARETLRTELASFLEGEYS